MSKNEHIKVGVVVKPHGLKGEMVVFLEKEFSIQFRNFTSIFVDMQGSMVPYTISSYASLNGGKVKIGLSGISNSEDCNLLRGKDLYQLTSLLQLDRQIDIVGFTLKLENGPSVGEIVHVNRETAQPLLVVEQDDEEVFIPFVEQFIVKVDEASKTVLMNLPDGMLDL